MSISQQYEPKIVLGFFEEFSRIPRGSGNEQAMSDYLVNFATKNGLQSKRDNANNVVIYKPGTPPSHDNHPPLILQAHMDMVNEKNADTVHDFLTDPITLRVEGDKVFANGTTLGADNGVGMAMILAILDNSYEHPHPPIEAIFTTDEETGMTGVAELDASWLTARRMINLDSGDEGEICVGCAGGVRAFITVPVEWEPLNQANFLKINVRGLKGGHSGTEINLERANSNRVLARVITAIKEAAQDVQVVKIAGGLKNNAIPREAEVIISVPSDKVSNVKEIVSAFEATLRNEYRVADPDISLTLTDIKGEYTQAFSPETTKRVLAALLLTPNGVQAMSQDIPGLVETSNNIGVVETTENAVKINCALRSSVSTRIEHLRKQIITLSDSLNAGVEFSQGYPGWAYAPNSPLRETAIAEFEKMFDKKPIIQAVHAGLECGFFLEKIPGMDIISYGSDIHENHSPNEHFSIPSLQRIWRFTIALLESL